jgi:deferrochelatase/peroxidase EfeB
LNDRRVHFDFRDGISQPLIRGVPESAEYSSHRSLRVAPGEFLLGHENEEAIVAWSRSRIGATFDDFFNDGSFAALRKMEQDVKGFQDETDTLATRLDADPSGAHPTGSYLRAKMCGRWPNGALVKPGQRTQPPDPGKDLNDFDFSEDPAGEGCPMGSHIRRLNPRNDDVVPGRKRPLIRRGIPYGPEYDPEVEDESERGLLGLFICASLEDQFEFLMHDWVDRAPLRKGRKGGAKDPLIAGQDEPGAILHIPVEGLGGHELRGLHSHVTTKGTLYAFYPSIPAIARIARQPDQDADDAESETES